MNRSQQRQAQRQLGWRGTKAKRLRKGTREFLARLNEELDKRLDERGDE
jgi:hypothetical protein